MQYWLFCKEVMILKGLTIYLKYKLIKNMSFVKSMPKVLIIIFLFIVFAIPIPVSLISIPFSLINIVTIFVSGEGGMNWSKTIADIGLLGAAIFLFVMILFGIYPLTYVTSLVLTVANKKLLLLSFLPLVHCIIACLLYLLVKYLENH